MRNIAIVTNTSDEPAIEPDNAKVKLQRPHAEIVDLSRKAVVHPRLVARAAVVRVVRSFKTKSVDCGLRVCGLRFKKRRSQNHQPDSTHDTDTDNHCKPS